LSQMPTGTGSDGMNKITFLSDFGDQDGYVGAVKGAVYSINPATAVIDISHQITPFHVGEAAYVFATYYDHFPKGTVHLAVVDPGVGSARKGLILQTARYHLVGPDNGLFSYVLQREACTVYEINEKKVAGLARLNRPIHPTFHGRDVFGPAAALISKGIDVRHFGEPYTASPVDFSRHITRPGREIEANIISVDRFGNLISSFSRYEIDQFQGLEISEVSIGGQRLAPLATTYSDVAEGDALALWGSSGFLEIAANRASAAQRFNARAGETTITIVFRQPGDKS
jgi:S-adenosylmethionine hydrolase